MKFRDYIKKDENIEKVYKTIEKYYNVYLKSVGVKMPNLKTKGNFTKDTLVLTYLARGYPKTRIVSKKDLTEYIRKYYPSVSDVQQARHLGKQKGWYILSGTRGDMGEKVPKGSYKLVSLEQPYPGFSPDFRSDAPEEKFWQELKQKYGNSCSTCGSVEGQPNRNNKSVRTSLDKGHKDPTKPLGKNNIIPQCQICNRADKNNWVYDNKGRVTKLANPNIIKRSSKETKWEVYKILYKEFKGKKP